MGIEINSNIKYRYPGTKFFEPDQREIFFGREQECRDLIHAIKAHELFVIFADSGIGKTSLLNAGLIPELINEYIEPIKFRFQDVDVSPLEEICNKLGFYIKQQGNSVQEGDERRLWRLFKTCDFKGKKPLFIFDQFEEFFNHPKQKRDECIAEIADLNNEYLPDYIREEMRQKFRDTDPRPEELRYYAPASLKMLFLIRADKLKLMDDVSKKIPLILRNRFQLKPLNIEQAEQAIRRPASLAQNGFASVPFEYENKAVEQICNYLKNEEEEVESFQLQILCQELEKRIIARQEKEKSAKSLIITEEELGGEHGMDDITKNYYANQINTITDEGMRRKAVELIEDRLIVKDRRISLPELLLTNEGFSKELLDYLVNATRLIRVNNERYFEISHDRLLPSILKSKQVRQEEEDRLKKLAAQEKLKKEEEEKRNKLQKEREDALRFSEQQRFLELERRTKRRLRTFSIVLVILLTVTLFAFYNANNSRLKAEISTINAWIFEKKYETADSVLHYDHRSKLTSFFFLDTLKKLQDTIQVKQEQRSRFYSLTRSADSLLFRAAALEDSALSLYSANEIAAAKNKLAEVSSLYQEAKKKYEGAVENRFKPGNYNEQAETKLKDLMEKIYSEN